METKNTTYDLDWDDPAPRTGQYLVGIGKRGLLSVNLIKSVREIKARVARDYARYAITMTPIPDLKPYTEFELVQYGDASDNFTANVWVRGIEALPFFWHPRSAK